MIPIKTQKEIETMEKAGAILGNVLMEVLGHVKSGISELELDNLAEKLIRQAGGQPGFKKVPGYKHTICVATNDVVVHGIPTKYKLKEDDIVGIDCGVFLDGFHTDAAETVFVGDKSKISPKIGKFLASGKKALLDGILQVKPGNHVGLISKAIQTEVEKKGGYRVTRSLIGHGVGRELHEEPEVPGYLAGKIDATPLLRPGMTIAVEVIYNMGGPDVVYSGEDSWTIRTEDGNLSSVFERTVLVTDSGFRIITPIAL